MAYPRRMNVGIGDVDSYLNAIVQQLMEEYTSKKTFFNHLKDDVIQLQYSVEKINTARRNKKENSDSLETTQRLKVKIGEIKGRLSSMMCVIGSLQTEDSEEHRYLRAVINQSEHRLFHDQPMREVHQQLANDIKALREIHEINCKEKQDLENIVNRAHHQLNKLEKVLRNEQQLREDKENLRLNSTAVIKGKELSTTTQEVDSTNRGLSLRDRNSRGSLH